MTSKHLLTLSGLPKSGTSSVADHITQQFDVAHVNGGDVFRALAAQRDMSLSEFSKHVNNNPHIDEEIDTGLERIADAFVSDTRTVPDLPSLSIDWDAPTLILESRLAGWLTTDVADLNVWLHAPQHIRIDRALAEHDTDNADEVRDQLIEREHDEAMRYDKQYDIDIYDRDPYDLCINTADQSIHDTVTRIRQEATSIDENLLVKTQTH